MGILDDDFRDETLVRDLRATLGIPDDVRPESIDVLRRLKLARLISNFEIVDDAALPYADARWDGSTIVVRRSVAERAASGSTDDCFTIFHEVGHLLSGHPSRNRRAGSNRTQHGRLIEADEGRADRLAMIFAAPEYLANISLDTTASDIGETFGLPPIYAERRLESLKRQFRYRHDIKRELPKGKSTITIDTGNYDEALPAMLRNAARSKI